MERRQAGSCGSGVADLAAHSSRISNAGVRLVALGTPYPTLRRAAVGSWRFSRRTGVRYGGRDVPFPSRTRQIKRVHGRALRLARSHLASGGLSSAPSQREEEKREKKPVTSSSCPSPPWSSIRRRPKLLPELELTGAGPHPSSGSPARRSSRRGAAVHLPPCSSPRAAVGGSPEILLPACSTRRRGEPPAPPAAPLLEPPPVGEGSATR
jgi:hypothetical protein